MIRDADDQRSRYGATTRETRTDDRGVYRIYGLPTGTYLVMAGGANSDTETMCRRMRLHRSVTQHRKSMCTREKRAET